MMVDGWSWGLNAPPGAHLDKRGGDDGRVEVDGKTNYSSYLNPCAGGLKCIPWDTFEPGSSDVPGLGTASLPCLERERAALSTRQKGYAVSAHPMLTLPESSTGDALQRTTAPEIDASIPLHLQGIHKVVVVNPLFRTRNFAPPYRV